MLVYQRVRKCIKPKHSTTKMSILATSPSNIYTLNMLENVEISHHHREKLPLFAKWSHTTPPVAPPVKKKIMLKSLPLKLHQKQGIRQHPSKYPLKRGFEKQKHTNFSRRLFFQNSRKSWNPTQGPKESIGILQKEIGLAQQQEVDKAKTREVKLQVLGQNSTATMSKAWLLWFVAITIEVLPCRRGFLLVGRFRHFCWAVMSRINRATSFCSSFTTPKKLGKIPLPAGWLLSSVSFRCDTH